MPLSPEAAARLARRSGKAEPLPTTPAPPPEPEDEPEELDETPEERATRLHNEKAKEFYKKADRDARAAKIRTADSEHWFALCFWTERDLQSFCDRWNLTLREPRPEVYPRRRYLAGSALQTALAVGPATGPISATKRAANVLAARAVSGVAAARRLSAEPTPDPLAGVDYTSGDIETQCATEMSALLTAYQARTPDAYSPTMVDDSPHWFAVYFPDRAAKDAFLDHTGLDAIGDKYLDGHRVGEQLTQQR